MPHGTIGTPPMQEKAREDGTRLWIRKARELGAVETVNAVEVDSVQAILDIRDGVGADVALEIVRGGRRPRPSFFSNAWNSSGLNEFSNLVLH